MPPWAHFPFRRLVKEAIADAIEEHELLKQNNELQGFINDLKSKQDIIKGLASRNEDKQLCCPRHLTDFPDDVAEEVCPDKMRLVSYKDVMDWCDTSRYLKALRDKIGDRARLVLPLLGFAGIPTLANYYTLQINLEATLLATSDPYFWPTGAQSFEGHRVHFGRMVTSKIYTLRDHVALAVRARMQNIRMTEVGFCDWDRTRVGTGANTDYLCSCSNGMTYEIRDSGCGRGQNWVAEYTRGWCGTGEMSSDRWFRVDGQKPCSYAPYCTAAVPAAQCTAALDNAADGCYLKHLSDVFWNLGQVQQIGTSVDHPVGRT